MAGLTVAQIFSNAARAVPQRVAAVVAYRSLTFGQVEEMANRMARWLDARGVGRGDLVVTRCRSELELVPLFAALAKVGAVFAPVPDTLTATETAAVIEMADPSLIVLAGTGTGPGGVGGRPIPTLTVGEILAGSASEDGGPFEDRVTEDDPHVVFFTSGSSGRPKGVVLSHRVNTLRTHPGAQLEPRGAMVCVYPLFHMAAWTIALQQWQARDTIVLVEDTEGPTICRAVRRHEAARLNAVPAVWRRVLDTLSAEPPPGGTLPSLRFSDTGTSSTPPDLVSEIARASPNATLRIYYGSTEAGNVASLDGDDVHRRPGSCGLPSIGTEVRTAEDGELWVRGPLLFSGYFRDAGATAAAMADGWYRTGDLVSVDDDGYLYIEGRAGDLIRTGGEAVAPAEVEAALTALPELSGVAELAVVGLPDPVWGEVVCLVVVVRPGSRPPTVEELRAAAHGRLAEHKHPREVVVVEAIPRTPATGQVLRRRLVDRLSEDPTVRPATSAPGPRSAGARAVPADQHPNGRPADQHPTGRPADRRPTPTKGPS